MKKLFILFVLVFLSCSKDTILDTNEVCRRDCELRLIQVTVNGIHLIRDSRPVTIRCDKSTEPFDIKRDSKGKIILYKAYKCN